MILNKGSYFPPKKILYTKYESMTVLPVGTPLLIMQKKLVNEDKTKQKLYLSGFF